MKCKITIPKELRGHIVGVLIKWTKAVADFVKDPSSPYPAKPEDVAAHIIKGLECMEIDLQDDRVQIPPGCYFSGPVGWA